MAEQCPDHRMFVTQSGGVDERYEVVHQAGDVRGRRRTMDTPQSRGSHDHTRVVRNLPGALLVLVRMFSHQSVHFQNVPEAERFSVFRESGSDPVLRTAGIPDLNLFSCLVATAVPVVQRLRHLLFGERIPFECSCPVDSPRTRFNRSNCPRQSGGSTRLSAASR